ncbi:MAG: DinB family protein [Acidobacteriota bacterium]|nr:DinB family protein [Acidobacteriota bacterium]
MTFGGRQLADGFRTVRKNTIQVAEDIPAEQYGYKATPDVMSVSEMLAHIAAQTWWPLELHKIDHLSHVDFERFMGYMKKTEEIAAGLTSKAQIVDALRAEGETFAAWLESLDRATLNETVSFPPPVQPQTKTRFEMLLSIKEHEMHHRAQLMLIERLLGIVPHLTRNRQAAVR